MLNYCSNFFSRITATAAKILILGEKKATAIIMVHVTSDVGGATSDFNVT